MSIQHQTAENGTSAPPERVRVPPFESKTFDPFLGMEDSPGSPNEKKMMGMLRAIGAGMDDFRESFKRGNFCMEQLSEQVWIVSMKLYEMEKKEEKKNWLRQVFETWWAKAAAVIAVFATPFLYGFLSRAGDAVGAKFFGG